MAIRILLDRLLHDRRMSLSELADRAGLSTANLTLFKNGEARAVRFTTLDVLCRELGCEVGDLICFDSKEPEEADLAEDELE